MRRFLLVVALLAIVPAAARAWNDEGHMLVAQVAWQRLTPAARAQVQRLLTVNSRPESADFVTAACWADDLKRRGDHSYDKWHYVDFPFSTDGTPLPKELDRENLLAGLNACVRTLKDPRAEEIDRADMLRMLIHLAGDCHQPLHAVSRYSRALPAGDRGGNEFRVRGPMGRNLHSLWDGGVGLFTKPPQRPLTSAGRSAIAELAAALTNSFPPARVSTWRDPDWRLWARESFNLARTVAYAMPEDIEPPAPYVSAAQQVVRKRITVAGYRLAALLNRLYAPAAGAARQPVRRIYRASKPMLGPAAGAKARG